MDSGRTVAHDIPVCIPPTVESLEHTSDLSRPGWAFALPSIPDSAARLTGLLSGDLDMIEYLDFQQLPKVRGNPAVSLPGGEQGFYGCRLVLGLNLPPANDVKVRRALNFAVNRQLIVDAVLNGAGAPVWGGIIPEGRFGYAKNYLGDLRRSQVIQASTV